ncbi:MAG: cell envelope integrity protein CreD [Muribaculaceae bacterium]|nr:cell envelope integrity protein CreD [Muribaculaceae bacterium]
MEKCDQICRKPKYTMSWLGLHCLFVFGASVVLALLAGGVYTISSHRMNSGLFTESSYKLLSDAIDYSFAMISVTLVSLMMVDVIFRKGINYIQYGLIGCALALFYLLLLAISEKLPFAASYIIVTAMTVGLIGWFIKGITENSKAVKLTVGILVVEYALIYLLISIGSMALLVGSIVLFVLIAVAMYFTLRLRIEDEELIIK